MAAGSNYEYRCVAGPTTIRVRRRKEREDAVRAFEEIINYQAADGWEYVGIDEFQTSEPQGCLGVSGQRVTTLKMLVFRRQVSHADLPEEKLPFKMPKPSADPMPQLMAEFEGNDAAPTEEPPAKKKGRGVFAFIRGKKGDSPERGQQEPTLGAPESESTPSSGNGRTEPSLKPSRRSVLGRDGDV